MNIGFIVEPNKKGQIVIPKKIRDDLNINSQTPLNIVQRGEGIYIYPIEEVTYRFEQESSYADILEKTRGAWADEKGWEEREKKEER